MVICVVLTFSIKREIKIFHVVVSQRWKTNVVVSLIERFSIECRKTKTKVITTAN